MLKNGCGYFFLGCTTLVLHTEKSEHEENCEFRPYTCPCPGKTVHEFRTPSLVGRIGIGILINFCV